MPELPEVESVRRLMQNLLVGAPLSHVEAVPDTIVYKSQPASVVQETLLGATVTGTGRKGKYFWLNLAGRGDLLGHLGMSGWIRQIGGESEKRLVSHGNAKLDDENGRPKFLKLMLGTEQNRVAFTDGRRLGRIWLCPDARQDPSILVLGPDCLTEPRTGPQLQELLGKRNAPIKALLLDQKLFAGVGNWVADEVLYHARIAPARLPSSFAAGEMKALADALSFVLETASSAEAEPDRYPEDWLFSYRWGGAMGAQEVMGHAIRRETIGGRTTAWVPDIQQ